MLQAKKDAKRALNYLHIDLSTSAPKLKQLKPHIRISKWSIESIPQTDQSKESINNEWNDGRE